MNRAYLIPLCIDLNVGIVYHRGIKKAGNCSQEPDASDDVEVAITLYGKGC